MLRGTASSRPPARETSTETDMGDGEFGRISEYQEPTMTFEPYESTTSMLKSPARLTPTASSNNSNPLLSNLQHQRQYSAPNVTLLPATLLPTDTRSRSQSPPKRGHTRHQSQGMPLTGDGRPPNSPGRFGGWLSGTSASADASPDTTPKSRRSITTIDTTPKNTTPSRFGFLASSMSALTTRLTSQTPTSSQEEIDDELCNLDIEAVLYPAAQSLSPTERDTFSPAAYKNLQANAAGLLHKMQDAYRQRTRALREVQAEREAQREEMEETELRTRNFKSQLESMAAKAAEQEDAMRRLMEELQAEKKARQEDERTRDKAKGLVEAPLLITTEDLCVEEEDRRRRWRNSDGTVRSDLSTDTDGESTAESESIFSRSRSPTATVMTSATTEYGGENNPLESALSNGDRNSSLLKTPSTPRPRSTPHQQQQPLTTFQKLVKNISGEDGCGNCRGQDSSVAWDTVGLLRDENRSLKHRVAHLEVVVEGALDVVNGIGLS